MHYVQRRSLTNDSVGECEVVGKKEVKKEKQRKKEDTAQGSPASISTIFTYFKALSFYISFYLKKRFGVKKKNMVGTPGWLHRLSNSLQLRS